MSSISLPLLVFRHRVKRATDATWHALCSKEYAARWWSEMPDEEKPKDISEYPGDRKTPFGSIKLHPNDFIKAGEKLQSVHIENSIITVAAAFEAYMADVIGRCVRLKPELLSTSEMTLTVAELVQPNPISDLVSWLSQEYVQKMVRNKSHSKLIKRFGGMIKRDISAANSKNYEEWNKFILLRNSIVHAGGLVTEELASSWHDRFNNIKSIIKLDSSDIVSVHRVAYSLANTIDKFAIETVIGKSDAELLARELFVSNGIKDEAEISRIATKILGVKFSKGDVASAIAKQKREQDDPSKEFYIREEWLCRPHDIYT